MAESGVPKDASHRACTCGLTVTPPWLYCTIMATSCGLATTSVTATARPARPAFDRV